MIPQTTCHAARVYLEQILDMSGQLDQEIAQLDDAIFNRRPGPSQNTIAFLYFHILRLWDLDLNMLARGQSSSDDAWHRGKYTAESGYDPDGQGWRGLGFGIGYSDAEVDAVVCSKAVLQRYHRQLVEETICYLTSVTDTSLHQPLPTLNLNETAADRMQHMIAHSYEHLGDIRSVRGLLGNPVTR